MGKRGSNLLWVHCQAPRMPMPSKDSFLNVIQSVMCKHFSSNVDVIGAAACQQSCSHCRKSGSNMLICACRHSIPPQSSTTQCSKAAPLGSTAAVLLVSCSKLCAMRMPFYRKCRCDRCFKPPTRRSKSRVGTAPYIASHSRRRRLHIQDEKHQKRNRDDVTTAQCRPSDGANHHPGVRCQGRERMSEARLT